ncbi:hypothetical protein [Pseudomonas syringae]|uniref:Uncharacterized protein n=1 Tax=Pseudomonas syringae TaxID=317 RepID=A0A085VGD7_PSESX|nr:hypothetical protein [Pseudomonas syringae]KFE54500.1 hypothetical protein IV01_15425 [Pseudomonas syringae]
MARKWSGPYYDALLDQQLLSVAVVSRDANGKPLFMTGYELKLNERLTRIEQLLSGYPSLLLDAQRRRVADLSANLMSAVSQDDLQKLLGSFPAGSEFPRIGIFDGSPMVAAYLSEPDWYARAMHADPAI